MKVLAFDTSTKFLSIACLEDSKVLYSFHEDAGTRHSEMLMPVIRDMLAGAGWKMPDIGLICAGTGPGSFTGLRIAVATAKGMAAAMGTGVTGVPSMDAMIMNAPSGVKFAAPFLDARKEKIYTCVYDCSGSVPERLTDYLLVKADDFLRGLDKEVLFFGDGIEKYKKTLDMCAFAKYDSSIDWYPKAAETGRIGFEKSAAGTDDPELLDPLYLHAKECNITLKKFAG
ncbi:MAG: tRNA (adenosine(37)-N6)-threonylcarbamoyltransferase complex dimerization subunit type 1 TsaB [Candidatus Omnitrophota bacterium]